MPKSLARAIHKVFWNACPSSIPYGVIVDYILAPCPAVAITIPNTRVYYVRGLCREGAEELARRLPRTVRVEFVTEGGCPSGWFEWRRCGDRRICAKKPARGLDFYAALGSP